MKKLGILFLAVLLIFSAGCITSVEDESSGTWTETKQYEDYTLDYTLTLNPDGSGSATYDYSDGIEYLFSARWKNVDENIIVVEEIYSCILNEDGSLTDYAGYSYEKTEGGEGLPGFWVSKEKPYTYLFNEDGTGVDIILSGEEKYEYPFIWRIDPTANNVIQYWYTYPYLWTEEGLIISDTLYEEVSLGEYVCQEDGDTDTLIFYEDEWCVRTIVTEEGEESIYYYNWIENDKIGYQIVYGDIFGYRPLSTMIDEGMLIYGMFCYYELQADGTLVCQDHDSVLTQTN